MVEYKHNGKPITGVYCSDMRDMLLVKKDAFKHMYDRLQTLENDEKTRREQRIKEIQSGATETATQQLIIMAKLEELRQENAKLREQLSRNEHDNMALLSDGRLWEVLTARYFSAICLPDCTVMQVTA